MMKLILLMTMMTTTIFSCSMTSDWIPSSVTEASKLAGAVMVGDVIDTPSDSQLDSDNGMILNHVQNDREIYLDNAIYYKGFGPKTVKITGYTSGSMCGISPPEVGAKVIVFACKDENSDGWKLHQYTSFAGQKEFNEENMKDLEKALGRAYMSDSEPFVYTACQERSEDFQNQMKLEEPSDTSRDVKPIPQREVIPIEQSGANQSFPIKIDNIFENLVNVRDAADQNLANATNNELADQGNEVSNGTN